LKFKPQYHRPDKCNRPIDRAPDPACSRVSPEKKFFSRPKLNPLKKNLSPVPQKKNGRFFFLDGGSGNGQLMDFEDGDFYSVRKLQYFYVIRVAKIIKIQNFGEKILICGRSGKQTK
jgi:hypothetical protein